MSEKGMPALSMSQTKEDLVKYLGMRPETYALMAKETDALYKWLTAGTQHLKSNCTREPPYDWSDITELSKETAMIRLAQGGDSHTKPYWNLAEGSEGCPNWIARWFLYHKFRYRDGRNRGKEHRGSARQGNNRSGRTKVSTLGDGQQQQPPQQQQQQYYQQTTSQGGLPPSSPPETFNEGGMPGQTVRRVASDSSYSSGSPYVGSSSTSASSRVSSIPASPMMYDPVKGFWRPKD